MNAEIVRQVKSPQGRRGANLALDRAAQTLIMRACVPRPPPAQDPRPEMILYDLFPLLAGSFSRWDRHFERARAMGFDWVFVNPIQRTGASGSLYSVADYFSVNAAFLDPQGGGTADDQVRRMTARAHGAGLQVMIDLVINHCAVDSALTREHPEWFVRGPDGRVANPSCRDGNETVVWCDLAQFDHWHSRDAEGLYQYCLRVVQHLASLGFDGFRCDAAYKIPPGFWSRMMRDARARDPGLCFVAETLGCSAEETRQTARAGFNFVFNSSKWWNYHDGWLIEGYNLVRETSPSISFAESHDTRRLADELDGNTNAIKQRYLFSALFSTGVMIPAGFEYGMRKPLHVIHSSPADWTEEGPDLRDFITRVNAIKRGRPIFQEDGPTSFPPCDNPSILLMRKSSGGRGEALLILNKDVWHHQEFYASSLRHFLPHGVPLRDVSPEFPLESVNEPFHYALRPGQGIVLMAARP